MGRRFDLKHQDRALKVCVLAVDEAWEFWLCEQGRQLALGARLMIDDAVKAWRAGTEDPFGAACRAIHERLIRGEIVLPDAGDRPLCPE
ncbi:hypothetical protein SAMN02745126_02087 [Enhydrobacter aerosaccus]|uniref:DUF982 domain-containing protein n=1 Tax=Enhydrobacter aerosaccus TaxID=225324 RepID=A0A1T4N3A7_9HYPH|nr:hypothetical protein [Enhydrobacter aerosaccus]SJZ73702.1 hypothetical protein SAMN02745126_02087 [Enhydrobacter aerosaccus]